MALEVTIPRLGWGMEKGIFLEWRKREGDSVTEGDVLFVIEGDKAAQEIEAPGSGVLAIAPGAPAPGEEVPVGRVVGHLLSAGEKAPEVRPLSQPPAAEPPAAPPRAASATPPEGRVARGGSPAASPRARRVARELGVEWRALRGSGTSGRVTERDVRGAAVRAPAASDAARRSRIAAELDTRRLKDLAARVSSLYGAGVPASAVLAGLCVRLCAAALASLEGAGVDVACARPVGDTVSLALVKGAERAPVAEIARSLNQAPPLSGAPGTSARFVVVPGELLGLESYEPGSQASGPPMVVVGKARSHGATASLAMHFDESSLGIAAASRLVERLKAALEAPELWLAR
jgi:pyruvate/2-oxoglutarate dehydrogenase complex dihydrolipoamide acyltransferase (E2) component